MCLYQGLPRSKDNYVRDRYPLSTPWQLDPVIYNLHCMSHKKNSSRPFQVLYYQNRKIICQYFGMWNPCKMLRLYSRYLQVHETTSPMSTDSSPVNQHSQKVKYVVFFSQTLEQVILQCGPVSNSSDISYLSWLSANFKKIQFKMNMLGWRHGQIWVFPSTKGQVTLS